MLLKLLTQYELFPASNRDILPGGSDLDLDGGNKHSCSATYGFRLCSGEVDG